MQKRVAEEEEEDQSCDGLCETRSLKGRYERPRVEDHRRRQREMENINNQSRRSNQVTWTPPRKGTRGRRRMYFLFLHILVM